MTTKLPLTDERLSTISDYFVAMEEHYSDPADRENFEIFILKDKIDDAQEEGLRSFSWEQ